MTRPGEVQLRDDVDSALEALVRDGTLPALLQRWGLWTEETGRMLGVELLLMIYSAVTLAWALATHNTGPVLLMGTSVVGLGYMVITGIVEARQSAGARTPAITSEKSMSI